MTISLGSVFRGVFAAMLTMALGHLGCLGAQGLQSSSSSPSVGLLKERDSAPHFGAKRVDHVEVELVSAVDAFVPGAPLLLGLRIRHDPHWHTYWLNPGDSGLATQAALQLPTGWRAGEIQWPTPKRLPVPPLANYGFEDDLLLTIPVELPRGDGSNAASAEAAVQITAKASWLVCKDVCIPGEAFLGLKLPMARQASKGKFAAVFETNTARLPQALEGKPLLATLVTLDAQKVALKIPSEGWAALVQARGMPNGFDFFPSIEGAIQAPATQKLFTLADQSKVVVLEASPQTTNPTSEFHGRDLPGVLALQWRLASGSIERIGFEVKTVPADHSANTQVGATLRKELSSARVELESSISAVVAVKPSGESSITIWLALALALLGGLLLNLMPCVFPVLGLKVLSFAQMSNQKGGMKSATWFSAGVVLSFLALGGFMLFLRQAGQAVGWGFQLQSPVVVAGLCVLFVALALNLFGVFEFGTSAMRAAGDLDQKYASQFASGVLAALVATPCTAPFMGSAIGFTLDQPPLLTLTVFALLGLGMALPYFVLALVPTWVQRLPRPGAWMETFKQTLGFPMLLTAVWLLWVFAQLRSIDTAAWLAVISVVIGFALWSWGKSQRSLGAAKTRFLVVAGAGLVLCATLAVYTLPRDVSDKSQAGSASDVWQAYDESKIQSELANGNSVFVDFTAAWCISCQANKKLVLESSAAVHLFKSAMVKTFRADWTKQDPVITAALARLGRNGVPVYLVLKPGQAPLILPELLTVGLLQSAFK